MIFIFACIVILFYYNRRTTSMKQRYIIGLDAGTTSVRSVVYDIVTKKIICLKRANIAQFYPNKGWVEEDAEEIFFMLCRTMEEAIAEVGKPLSMYIGVGLTNQRETIVAFNKETGKPVARAIVWQDKRTNDYIQSIPPKDKKIIKQKTGLIPDSYFSASKMQWILQNSKRAQDLLEKDKLCIGTLDSYLAYKFTGNFVTDTTNASRTMLMNIEKLNWDESLCSYFKVPTKTLPKIISSSEYIGNIQDLGLPLLSIIGDQQSSLFGNGCTSEGMAKNTYGTGCFLLLNTGKNIVSSDKILTTIAYTMNGQTTYALEGSVFSACSALNWVKKHFDIDEDFDSLDKKISKIENHHGVYFVPAFTGLGSPYWSSKSGAEITGMTLDTTKYTVFRSAYESMAYNTKAIIDEMEKLINIPIKELRADGGGSKSKFLLQYQADILNTKVMTGDSSEATVLGCIFMAGLAANALSLEDIRTLTTPTMTYTPSMQNKDREMLYAGWQNAVNKLIK